MNTKYECYRSLPWLVASAVLEQLGPVGRSLLRVVRSTHHGGLTAPYVNPNGFRTASEFFPVWCAVNLLKKYPGLNTGINLRQTALDKFLESETVCANTNIRFVNRTFDPLTLSLLERARRFVYRVLGEDFSWDQALVYADFGPGASVGVPRRAAHAVNKIGHERPTVTGPCVALVDALRAYDPHLGDCLGTLEVVPGSNATTVPKDARSDRFIAIEPLWNMFFQKGIGGMIRNRLRRVGLDLDTAHSKHHSLARRGSRWGSLSTIDLSSASDSIALELVRYLVPPQWMDALMIVRSPRCTLPDGNCVFLRKISSMGNGFTFELESLLFLALAKACVPRRKLRHTVSVFGDDIITPSRYSDQLVHLLHNCGFKVNREKSFTTGPFRESCGKHFFLGVDVTPFYLRKEIRSAQDVLWLANSLKRLAHRSYTGYGCDIRFRPGYEVSASMLGALREKLAIPDGFGDGGLLRDFDDFCPSPAKDCWEGYIAKIITPERFYRRCGGVPALVQKLWYTRKKLPLGEGSSRSLDKTSEGRRLRVVPLFVPRWPSMGPWL